MSRKGLVGAVVGLVVLVAGAGLVVGTTDTSVERSAVARLRPVRALGHDFVVAARAIQAARDRTGRPPRTTTELMEAMDGAELGYTRIQDGQWLDPWGRPIAYRATRLKFGLGWSVRLYSLGPDGRDDNGYGDDILMDRTPRAGTEAVEQLQGLVDAPG